MGLSLIGALAAVPSSPAPRPAPRTLLAVFAHPDDETTMSGTLARYRLEGVSIVLATVTSGQKGGPNPGDALGARREAELRAACRELGLGPPVLFGFMDGTVATDRHDEIRARIRELVRKVRPQVMVTFGPDGVTGHPDHIAVGQLATEVFDEETALAGGPRRLFYVVLPRSVALKVGPALAGRPLTEVEERKVSDGAVPDDSVTVTVDITRFLDMKRRAAARHESQFPAGPKYEQWRAVFGTEEREYFVLARPPSSGRLEGFFEE